MPVGRIRITYLSTAAQLYEPSAVLRHTHIYIKDHIPCDLRRGGAVGAAPAREEKVQIILSHRCIISPAPSMHGTWSHVSDPLPGNLRIAEGARSCISSQDQRNLCAFIMLSLFGRQYSRSVRSFNRNPASVITSF